MTRNKWLKSLKTGYRIIHSQLKFWIFTKYTKAGNSLQKVFDYTVNGTAQSLHPADRNNKWGMHTYDSKWMECFVYPTGTMVAFLLQRLGNLYINVKQQWKGASNRCEKPYKLRFHNFLHQKLYSWFEKTSNMEHTSRLWCACWFLSMANVTTDCHYLQWINFRIERL